MTLYFDTRVQNPENASINTCATWHSNLPFLAVAAFSQDKGGFVTLFDDQGEPLQDVETPGHSVAQVTALVWHPERKWLVIGWESGEMRVCIQIKWKIKIRRFVINIVLDLGLGRRYWFK